MHRWSSIFHQLVVQARSTRGSSRPVAAAGLLALVVLGGTFLMRERQDGRATPHRGMIAIQDAGAGDARAYYIAQTALDRSVKHLTRNPNWRDGFTNVAFDSGFYNVKLFDDADDAVPANYVRIVASSEVDGVSRSLEAVWVNTLAAFDYAYAAGDRVEITNHDSSEAILVGSVHCNAWRDGDVVVDDGATVFGNLTTAGHARVGSGGSGRSAVIFGDLSAARLSISDGAAISAFENLNEREIGLDLNGDGDASDFGVGQAPLRVEASASITTSKGDLRDGAFHATIGSGMVGVTVGREIAGPIFDPRPDFSQYYELASGRTSYPPGSDHVVNDLSGDGKGHYFASNEAFLAYLDFQIPKPVTCPRCAGDGTIGPESDSACSSCQGIGKQTAIEIAGIYYIDDELVDLSQVERHLVVHGTIVVAQGDPYSWPEHTVTTPAGDSMIRHFPQRGSFVLRGNNRPHFTQTYRSSSTSGSYSARPRRLGAGYDEQAVARELPLAGQELHDFPALIAADRIELAPREAGFASHPGDIGGEAMTHLQGVVYAENHVSLHGRGGHRGGEIVFNEREGLGADDALDEAVLNVDLNEDGDLFDRVRVESISGVPVIGVGPDRYGVDINADGVLDRISIGTQYATFFEDGGYALPTLIYLEGCVLSQSIHSCEQVRVVRDSRVATTTMPYGFGVNDGSPVRNGLVSWSEAGN